MPDTPQDETKRWTPGPWVASFEEMGGYDCMSDSWDVRDGIGRLIAQSDLGKRPSDAHAAIVAANARLIAAAPDLADAIVQLREALAGFVIIARETQGALGFAKNGDDKLQRWSPAELDAAERALEASAAALARARGEQ